MTMWTAEQNQRPIVLCLGAGFTSKYLAHNFADVCDVFFLSRRPDELEAVGLKRIAPDALERVTMVLDTTPAADGGGLAYPNQISSLLLENINVIYVHISTTSVYGGSDADSVYTVHESTPPSPDSTSARARLDREDRILSECPGACVIRAGGIYGPGRSLAESFRSGDFRRAGTGNRIVSRIHVHDLCALALGLGTSFLTQRIINGVDAYPAPNKEVFEFLESELNLRVPDDPGAWRTEPPKGRRVESLYARSYLPNGYQFPTYREGFRSCLRT